MRPTPQTLALVVLAAAMPGSNYAIEPSPAPEGAEIYFVSPANGAHVSSKFTVRFGLRGMGIAPAGIDLPNTGHHHLLINPDPMPDLTLPLPTNDQIRHFGKGQTETDIELKPGAYTLQLLLGNHLHIPHQPPVMSGTITVNVE